ncbi:hypothetical protein WG66_000918 [Moniliophthora roreri]|uniref:DUF6535 domain-containing protein n=1 Tax=Moniliophthora roreri TaxID=221103 RepID=A0A0W0FIE5_MONRR|nr:hypothetical protein WG66_000918 [Moniliophthora roreri]
MSTVEQNSALPVLAAQIPLPPSPPQSVREDESTSRYGTAPSSIDATGMAKKKKGSTVQQSWQKLMAEVEKYDDGTVKNWKEDIDTLLVFAGLFSAVVTAFLIEAYQWLSEDPADTTVVLLTRISMQLNASQTILPEHPQFEPDASSIRINCFWFFSLVFSLTSALFGLLCKQWLREQQRDPPTKTPGEALALRQIRRDSFEKWGVSLFLSVLPILLEIALLLFFVGVLDLLWNRHLIPFAFCFVAVVLSAGLYFVTTFLPVLILLFQKPSWLSYQFICPYKSPQAWAVYQLLVKALHTLQEIPFIGKYGYIWRLEGRLTAYTWKLASDWSSFDLQVIRWSSLVLPGSFNFNVYELRAFQRAFTTFQDSPSMLPHLRNVLGTLPPPVAMSAVLGDWSLTMWGDIQESDVELWFRDQGAFRRSLDWYVGNVPQPTLRDPTLLHSEGIRLLSFHQLLLGIASSTHTPVHEFDLVHHVESHHADLQKLVNLQFIIPFAVIEKLWMHDDPIVQEKSLQLIPFFEEAFSARPGYDEARHDVERLAFISALTKHLNCTSFTSYVATSTRGQEFIRYIHDQIVSRRLYKPYGNWDAVRRQELILAWNQVVQRVTEIGHLSSSYFMPILGFSVEATAQATDAHSINDPNHPPQTEDETDVPQSDHEVIDDSQGSDVPGSMKRGGQANELSINPDYPRASDRSHSAMTGFDQGAVPGSAERGEQNIDEIEGVGADDRV